MKLYLLELLDKRGWDKMIKVAVLASSESEARKITSLNYQGEGESAWLNEFKSSCNHIELKKQSKACLLVADINWG